jgi:hypothetical protein
MIHSSYIIRSSLWVFPNTFQELDLFPSSDVARKIYPVHLSLLERASLNHWTGDSR